MHRRPSRFGRPVSHEYFGTGIQPPEYITRSKLLFPPFLLKAVAFAALFIAEGTADVLVAEIVFMKGDKCFH
jgi:hypothetical protein